MLIRGDGLEDSMSLYLVQQIGRKANIRVETRTVCGIWANSKSFLLAPGRRADRVGQQATQRTVSTGMSGRILISSEELL